jgi:hypothetical protein
VVNGQAGAGVGVASVGTHAKHGHDLRFGAPASRRVAVLQHPVRAANEWLSLQQLSSPPWPVPSTPGDLCVCPPLPSR